MKAYRPKIRQAGPAAYELYVGSLFLALYSTSREAHMSVLACGFVEADSVMRAHARLAARLAQTGDAVACC